MAHPGGDAGPKSPALTNREHMAPAKAYSIVTRRRSALVLRYLIVMYTVTDTRSPDHPP